MPGCFGKPKHFKFRVCKGKDKNWRRSLDRHESLHDSHWSQRHLLLLQSAKMVASDSSQAWTCRDCSTTVSSLAQAANHSCDAQPSRPGSKRTASRTEQPASSTEQPPHPPPKKRRMGILRRARQGCKARRGKQARGTACNAAPVSLPANLQYTDLQQSFLRQRQDVSRLEQLSPASARIYAYLPLHPDSGQSKPSPRVGDFLPWPDDVNSFGCVWSIDAAANIHAVQFRRRPVDPRKTCALHPDSRGCWRPVSPIKSKVIPVPESYDATVCLQPRTTDSKSAFSLEGRCFQLCNLGVATIQAESPAKLCLQQFVNAAVQQLLEHSVATDMTVTPQSGASLWTPAVLQLFRDAICRELIAVERPTQCPDALDNQPCRFVKLQSRCPSRSLINASGCFRLVADRYICHTHGRSWTLPGSGDSRGCNLIGDVLGNFLIQAEWWPGALQRFLDTENYTSLERHIRQQTAAAIAAVVDKHPLRAAVSELELAVLNGALLSHCQTTPSAPTIKHWLQVWTWQMIVPHALSSVAAKFIRPS